MHNKRQKNNIRGGGGVTGKVCDQEEAAAEVGE